MYRDSFSPSPWARLLRLLEASFRVGRPFGVELRVYWIVLILLPLICAPQISYPGIGAAELLVHVALLVGLLYLVIYTHEMSHIVAGWLYGLQTPLITLSPLGGVAHMSAPAPTPRAEAWIALAGPAVHLVWLLVFWPLSELLPGDLVRPDGWSIDPLAFALSALVQINVALLAFNLLPFFPMDGGRVLRALLSRRMHPNRATLLAAKVGLVGAGLLLVVGLLIVTGAAGDLVGSGGAWGVILVVIAINNLVACAFERRAARYQASPYGSSELLAPWQVDPDAWKQSGAAEAEPARDSGKLTRWREQRRARAAERRQERAEQLERDLDRVLAKISEVGIENLSPHERSVLDRASKARRDTGS